MTSLRHVASIALCFGGARVASAQLPQTQHVPLSVSAIDKFAVTGSSTLQITVTHLTPPTTEFTTTYQITSNSATARKITAKLDLDLPAGITINVQFQSPGGGAVTAAKNLTAAPQDVVTNISHLVATPKTITYTVTVTPSFSPQTISRTVTFTIE